MTDETVPRRILGPALVVPALSAVVVIVGIVLVWHAAATPVSFGWFAYAPLSDTTFRPDLDRGSEGWGGVLVALGVVALGFWLGARVPRDSSTKPARRILSLGLPLAAVVIGAALARWGETAPLGFVFVPGSSGVFIPFIPVTVVGQLALAVGAVLVLVGLAVLAFAAGRRLAAARRA
ncbi:MAG: hypothetical protein JWP75_472 [Frondihabitans sp.]|nr:hypothetical protein [Frondihabitans sp.]